MQTVAWPGRSSAIFLDKMWIVPGFQVSSPKLQEPLGHIDRAHASARWGTMPYDEAVRTVKSKTMDHEGFRHLIF